LVASKRRANFIFGFVQKKMNEVNKVNDISKINENLVSLFRAKFKICFTLSNHVGNSRVSFPLFHAITENAIHPKICQCHYITSPIKTRWRPSSRKDKCKPVALCHPAIETGSF
jgi:hypothetical protein